MTASITSLAQFPVEVLDFILSGSNTGSSAVELWKCGSKPLNYRLSTGGVTSIHLKDHRPDSTSRFPKMLLSLQKLRYLSIDRSKCVLVGAYELRSLLLELNPGIESLKLICREAEACFFQNPKPNALHGCFPPSNYTHMGAVFESNASESPLWDIGQKFPKLTCLLVCADEQSILAPYSEHLPSTLTDLSILALDHGEDGKTREYPSSLVRLRINTRDLSFIRLPANLEHFSGFCGTIEDGYVDRLPKGLKSFPGLHLKWDPSVVGSVPPLLSSVTIGPVELSAFEELELNWPGQLPRFLTSLNVHCYTPLGSHQLRVLPSTLTFLSAFQMSWATITSETDYPPNLVHFETESETLTALDIAKLPRRLASLVIHPDSTIMSGECFKNLPLCLTSLDILATEMVMSPPMVTEFPELPHSLTHLRAQMVTFIGPFDDSGFPSCVKDRMPPKLTELSIDWETPRWEDLPDSLLNFYPTKADPDHFCKLPRHLVCFRSNATKSPTKASFQGLPASLTDLTLTSMTNYDVTKVEVDLFAGLPDGLKKFSFIASASTEMIIHLPRQLTRLDIKIFEISDATFKALPRSLKTAEFLEVEKNGFNSKSLQFLPLPMVIGARIGLGSLTISFDSYLLGEPLPVISPDPRILKHQHKLEQ